MNAQPALAVLAVQLLPDSHSCSVAGNTMALTALEYRTLALLMAQPGELVSRHEIETTLYGATPPNSNVLQVIVSRLRSKLAAAGAPGVLHTQRSCGYAFIGEVALEAAA